MQAGMLSFMQMSQELCSESACCTYGYLIKSNFIYLFSPGSYHCLCLKLKSQVASVMMLILARKWSVVSEGQNMKNY